jgi:mannose/fructose/N-acetylgalactosamine-specific phosphotransferase system component IIC
MIAWTTVTLAGIAVVGVAVALIVGLVRVRKARRLMAKWQPYLREGDAPRGEERAPRGA